MARTSVALLCVCALYGVLSISAEGKEIIAPTLKLYDGTPIPTLALGTWLGNSSQGRLEPESNEVEQAVTWALAAGYRHIDTAHVYKTEEQVGKAIKAVLDAGKIKRGDLFITTKLWNDAHPRSAVEPALRESLRKLGLDYVDLYLIHWPVGQYANGTYDLTDYLETWRGMIEVKALNLTKAIGLSNFNQVMIDRILANGLEKPAVLQVELNLNLQQPELISYCKEKEIVVMGYTPFGSLFPSKALPDSPAPRVDDPRLVTIADNCNKTVPQINLKYLVDLGVIPLPKSLTRSRIEQNIDIFDIYLKDEEVEILKKFDQNYRTIPQRKWIDNPYYPFEELKTKKKKT